MFSLSFSYPAGVKLWWYFSILMWERLMKVREIETCEREISIEREGSPINGFVLFFFFFWGLNYFISFAFDVVGLMERIRCLAFPCFSFFFPFLVFFLSLSNFALSDQISLPSTLPFPHRPIQIKSSNHKTQIFYSFTFFFLLNITIQIWMKFWNHAF